MKLAAAKKSAVKTLSATMEYVYTNIHSPQTDNVQ